MIFLNNFFLAILTAGIINSILLLSYADALLLAKTNLDHYVENDLIVLGKISSVNELPDTKETEYQVMVERYLKSPKNVDLITVFGQGVKSGPFQSSVDIIFNKGNRVVLLLNIIEERYVISPYSFSAELFNPDFDFILPPLKLYKAGISPEDIVCRGQLVLVIKSTNGMPACVKENHIERLVSIGWLDEDFLNKEMKS